MSHAGKGRWRRIWNIEFARAQRGWVCVIAYTVRTGDQFTDETRGVTNSCNGFSVFSMAVAFWRTWREYRQQSAWLNAGSDAMRKAKGWA